MSDKMLRPFIVKVSVLGYYITILLYYYIPIHAYVVFIF